MIERIVRQLEQENEKLTENVLKTILTANKVEELICTVRPTVLVS